MAEKLTLRNVCIEVKVKEHYIFFVAEHLLR